MSSERDAAGGYEFDDEDAKYADEADRYCAGL